MRPAATYQGIFVTRPNGAVVNEDHVPSRVLEDEGAHIRRHYCCDEQYREGAGHPASGYVLLQVSGGFHGDFVLDFTATSF